MRRAGQPSRLQCERVAAGLFAQGKEQCTAVALKPPAIRRTHPSQAAPALGEERWVEGSAVLLMEAQQLVRARRLAEEYVEL